MGQPTSLPHAHPAPRPSRGSQSPSTVFQIPRQWKKGHVCAWQRGAEETPGGRWMARTLTAQDRPGRCGLHHERASPGRREPWRAGPEHEDTLGLLQPRSGAGDQPGWLVEAGAQAVDEKHPASAVQVGARGCLRWGPPGVAHPRDPQAGLLTCDCLSCSSLSTSSFLW